jgi:SPP1 family predicted phage head-tail adaptor
MKIRSGKLDRQITIKRRSETVGASGSVSETWATVHDIRAEKVEHTSEDFLAAFGNAEAGHVVFRIRFLSDLKLTDKISFDGQGYDLEGITELGRKHGQELRGVLVQ